MLTGVVHEHAISISTQVKTALGDLALYSFVSKIFFM